MKEIYWYIVAAVIVLGMVMGQQGKARKNYIVVMAIIHTFVCGFRYQYLTGDLQKYHTLYVTMYRSGWLSSVVLQGGRNAGFNLFMKLIATLTYCNYQAFLFVVALIIELAIALLIYKYSPRPWLSYLVWNCLGFYIFGFSAVKQALSMAFVVFAMICVFERKPKHFALFVLIAGSIHAPALAFLPAYWLSKCRVNSTMIAMYLMATAVVFAFRDRIVVFVSEYYYAEEAMEMLRFGSERIGGRFFLIVLILMSSAVLKGFREKEFESLFHIIVVSAIFQMFSVYNNVFTRLADYYFQFSVLFIPMIFYRGLHQERVNKNYMQPILHFGEQGNAALVVILTVGMLWFYQYASLGMTIINPIDDYLNYRSMWG